MKRCLLAALLIVPLLGSDSPKEYDDHATQSGLEGTWQVVECNFCGERSKPSQPWTLLLRRGTFVEDNGDGNLRNGSYCIDPMHNPRRLDRDGCKEIYELSGDTLRIAYRLDQPEQYPQGFAGGRCEVVTVYKRVR